MGDGGFRRYPLECIADWNLLGESRWQENCWPNTVETGWTLAEITSPDGLARIEPEWRDLWERDPNATPFQSPDWLIPWTRRLWSGGYLRVLEIRHEAGLAAVAPFFLWGHERLCLSFLGSGISDYLGMTCDPTHAAQAARIVLRWINKQCTEWDLCDLQEIREDDPFLQDGAAEQPELRRLACSVCPVVALPPDPDSYLEGLAGKFRHNLRLAERRLKEAGRIEFIESGRGNWRDLLEDLFRLHEGRWNERQAAGMLSEERLREFHREVAEGFEARGMLRLHALRVNGASIGVQYNFTAKGRAYAYLSGFDTGWSRMSPGSVLLAHAIGRAIEDGAGEFDFLRKPEAFKYNWGARDESTRRLVGERQ